MSESQAAKTHAKPKHGKGTNIYFPPSIRAKVTKLSRADRRSISQMVCILLEEALTVRNGNHPESRQPTSLLANLPNMARSKG